MLLSRRLQELILAAVVLTSTGFQPLTAQSDDKGLNDYYKDYFTMGAAVTPNSLSGDEAKLILQHFGSITPENAMKMGPIHPEENRYFWDHSDKIVQFAVDNKLKVRGHTLCWHNQAPRWMFKDEKGNDVSKEVLLQRLKDHITTVVTRYKGKIYAWDVVNEVIADEKDKVFRDSPWYRICGEEFIAKAFEYAHAADPDAILFYNDYNSEQPVKRDKIIQLVQKLKANGVPIHGVGLQAHWHIGDPSESELKEALEKYSALGLQVQITELDVSVYPSQPKPQPVKEGEEFPFTPEMEQKQMDFYKMAFRLLREHKKSITGVTFWNVSDRYTWLDYFPVRGRKNYPLLFDVNLKPKKVYYEVTKF
jgi:endo-1,4-beta-xylanase